VRAAEPGAAGGWRGITAGLLLGGLSVGVLLLGLEAAFRLAPGLLPSGVYGAGRYDPALGLNVHAREVVYNKVRLLRKQPNGDGFLDVQHSLAKPPGTVRLAFFGDSYVEAAQVPTDQTFFRRLPTSVAGHALEPLAFGMSGWGTLHAWLASRHEADRYDVDVVGYVFVENDPGDSDWNLSGGRRLSPIPFAVPSTAPDGFRIVTAGDGAPGLGFRLLKGLQQSSLLAQVVVSRVQLLRSRGPALRARESDREMSGRAGSRVSASDLAGTWPEALRQESATLAERILRRWKADCDAAGRPFFVLYVPRGEAQLTGEIRAEDTWLPWLQETSAALGIELVDPSAALRRRLAEGVHVYEDHFSPDGHRVVAEVLESRLASWIAARRRAGDGSGER
jgi:hypothetical protein